MSAATGLGLLGATDYYRMRDKKLTEKELRAIQIARNKKDKPIPLIGPVSNQKNSTQLAIPYQYQPKFTKQLINMNSQLPSNMEQIVGRSVMPDNDYEVQIDTSTKNDTSKIIKDNILDEFQDISDNQSQSPWAFPSMSNNAKAGLLGAAGLAGAYGAYKYLQTDSDTAYEAKKAKQLIKDREIMDIIEKKERSIKGPKVNVLRLSNTSRNSLNTFLFKDFIQQTLGQLEEDEMTTPYALEVQKRIQNRQRYMGLPYKRTRF